MPAAGTGRGLVRKRGQTWTAYWWVNNKQQSKGGFPSKRVALSHLDAVLKDVRDDAYVEPSKLTLAEFLRKEWLPRIRAGMAESTWDSYRRECENHIIAGLGHHLLVKLREGHIEAWIAELLSEGRRNGGGGWPAIYRRMRAELGQTGPGRPMTDREPAEVTKARAKEEAALQKTSGRRSGLSKSSVRYYVVILHKALDAGIKWDMGLRENPADGLTEDLQPAKLPKRVWTTEQVKVFLRHRKDAGDRLHALYAADLATGLRRGELLGLRWDDHVFLDDDEPHLLIQETSVSVAYRVVQSAPKTQAGYRRVTLDPDTVTVLRAHREVQDLERMVNARVWQEHDLVFCQEDGTPYHPEAVSDTFDRAVKAAGVPRIPFRNMRHTHATLGLKAGVPLKVMSKRLGHASITITADIYQHVIEGMDKEAATAIGALIYEPADPSTTHP